MSGTPVRANGARAKRRLSTVVLAVGVVLLLGAGAAVAYAVLRGDPAAASDVEPPTPPSNPRVAITNCTTVEVSWAASTDNDRVAGYEVYQDGQQRTTVGGDLLSATVTGLTGGSSYGLYVNARDAAGNVSQASETAPVKMPQCVPDSQPPGAPTRVRSTGVSGTCASLAWNAATDNVEVKSYKVYANGSAAGTATATSTQLCGLTPRTRYQLTVTAIDQAGLESKPSAPPVTVTTSAACGQPVCEVALVATEKDLPWGLAQLPDGSLLYARRDAFDVIRLDPVTKQKTNAGAVPGVAGTDGEGGLLGIAVGPGFATDHWLYVYHSSPTDNRVIRLKYENNRLDPGSRQVLLSGILRNKFHDGGRLRFGPDGKLYIASGDGQNGDRAQDTKSLNGKVLRINPDGSIPPDNPFGNAVWSFGHRNPQGLAFDSQGRLWEQEFGNTTMDEINLIRRGGNYGWPACEGTSGACGNADFVAPAFTISTVQGSCSGIAIVRDVLFSACQRGTRMLRLVISGTGLTGLQTYFQGTYGRLRTIEPAADGGLWLTTTNGGDKDSVPNNSDNKVLHVQLSGT